MGKEGKRIIRRRKKLFDENPYCKFCKVKMILPETLPNYPNLKLVPQNMCTIEHLRSRLNNTRREKNINFEERTTICCVKCNNERGAKEVANLPIEELHRRSGRYKVI